MRSFIIRNRISALVTFISIVGVLSCQRKSVDLKEPIRLDERCYLIPDVGNCKMQADRYYYDSEAKRCKKFIYGGCNGVVPFIKVEVCREKCNCD